MNYQNFISLPEGIQKALLAGYNLPELESYNIIAMLRKHNFDKNFVAEMFDETVSENIEALQDGLKLFTAMKFVFSADSKEDLIKDENRYDNLADELNHKYGEIVYKTAANYNSLGFIGHKLSPFAEMQTTTYDSATKTSKTVVVNLHEQVSNENEYARNI